VQVWASKARVLGRWRVSNKRERERGSGRALACGTLPGARSHPPPSPLLAARTLTADAPAAVAKPVPAAASSAGKTVTAMPADAATQLAQATADALSNPVIAGRRVAQPAGAAPAPGLAVPLPKFGAVPQLGLPELPAVNLNVNPAALAATLPRFQFMSKQETQAAAAAQAQAQAQAAAQAGGVTSLAAATTPASTAGGMPSTRTTGPPKPPPLSPPKPAAARAPTHRPPKAEKGPGAAEVAEKHAPKARAPAGRPSPAEVFGEGRWADGAAGGNRRLLAAAAAAEQLVEPSAGPILTLPRLEIPMGGSASFLFFLWGEREGGAHPPTRPACLCFLFAPPALPPCLPAPPHPLLLLQPQCL